LNDSTNNATVKAKNRFIVKNPLPSSGILFFSITIISLFVQKKVKG